MLYTGIISLLMSVVTVGTPDCCHNITIRLTCQLIHFREINSTGIKHMVCFNVILIYNYKYCKLELLISLSYQLKTKLMV